MTRIAIYARYSDEDRQDARSIDDQLRLCREHAARAGLGEVVGIYADYGLTGTVLRNRPEALRLLAAARAREIDIVLAEALDRLSRDQEDVAAIYKRCKFAGVAIVTVTEGEIGPLHIGLKGTVNALYSVDLANKVRRGQTGRALAGSAPGGLGYGYRVVKRYDAKGEPVRGLREIDPDTAPIVRRIFTEFAAGGSPRSIAAGLNREGVPSPQGGQWNASTICGNKARASGILWNEAYAGLLVYNRTRFARDPDTGKRLSRPNPRDQWTVAETPELRIVDKATWDAARARQAARSLLPGHKLRLPKHAFSGLLRCALCGSSYVVRQPGRLGCTGHAERGLCGNGSTITLAQLEARVLAGLRRRLLAPDAMQAYIAEYHAERARLAAAEGSRRRDLDKRLATIAGELGHLVDALAQGLPVASVKDRVLLLEREREDIRAALAAIDRDAEIVTLHPRMVERYQARIADLSAALAGDGAERHQAIAVLRDFIEAIEIAPADQPRGPAKITAYGLLPRVLQYANARSRVNETGTFAMGALVARGGYMRFPPSPLAIAVRC